MSNDTHPAPLDTLPASLTASSIMYGRGDCVRHVKSFRLYIIVQTPATAFDEETGEPRYVYRSADPHDPRWWIRKPHIMEDGRFVLHKKSPLV